MFAPVQPQLSGVVAQAAAAAALFKPGQVLEALVVGKTPDGLTALRIGDIVVQAQLPQTLPPGTTLQLQVKSGGPAPQLLVVGTPQLPVASTPIAPSPALPLTPLSPAPLAPAPAMSQPTPPAPQTSGTTPSLPVQQAVPPPVISAPAAAPVATPTPGNATAVATPAPRQQGAPPPAAAPAPVAMPNQPTPLPASPRPLIAESTQQVVPPSAPNASTPASPTAPAPRSVPPPPAIAPAAANPPVVTTAPSAPSAPVAPIPSAPASSPQPATAPAQAPTPVATATPQVAPAVATAQQAAPPAAAPTISASIPAAVSIPVATASATPSPLPVQATPPPPSVQAAPAAAAQPTTTPPEPSAASPLLVAQSAARPPATAADLPRPTQLSSPGAIPPPAAPPAQPTSPAAALAQMVPEALARQNVVAPLLASLATIVARPGGLPEPVLRAALQVLGQRAQLPPNGPTGPQLEAAIAKSGVYLEAGLAKGAAPAADLKSSLVALKGALTTFLGGNPAPVTAAQQAAPPLRGMPPRAEVPDLPPLPDAPRDAARALHSQADAALSRVKLMQFASLPDADPVRQLPQELRMEVPFLLGQQLVMAQFQVFRDGGRQKSEGKRGWTMRFAMNLPAAGEIGAEVGLLGRSVNVALWAADPDTAAGLEAALPELAPALSALGLEPGSVRVRNLPPEAPKPASGQYLDSRR